MLNNNHLKQLIKNLRRGDDMEKSKQTFFPTVENLIDYWCKNLSLRWLVSVVDTYIDHGTSIEARNAMVVSTYFNMVKIADSALLLYRANTQQPATWPDVTPLYDQVNSLKLATDDMPNILFYRIDKQLADTPVLKQLFEEIKQRLAKHSTCMSIANHHKGFYNKIFFEGRRCFLDSAGGN